VGVRIMTTGFGLMHWSFSQLTMDPHGAAVPEPVRVYAHGLREGHNGEREEATTPRVLLDLGFHDVDTPDSHPAAARLSDAERALLARHNPLVDVQSDARTAWRVAREERARADPGQAHASGQTCFSCHLAQERATMALRVSARGGAREYGYFFRHAGYVGAQPFLTRRVVAEARRVAWRLQREERNP
jgi:hypothetical protein